MDIMAIDRLDSIEKSRNDFKIKVRVTRMWATIAPETGTSKGFNLILLDDDNAHVHAFGYADVWNIIGSKVVEGGVYLVQNFGVRDSIGNLKPVSSRHTIRLQSGTTFESCEDDGMIPFHKFEFLDLGDLFKEASKFEPTENPEFAIDIIGVVEEFEKCKSISTRFGDRDIVRFRLCDRSNRHRVAVWGDLAKIVQDEYAKDLEKPVIAVLTSTKLTTFKNSVQISTLPSSKVYFNLNDDSVNEMRMRLEDECYGFKTPIDNGSYSPSLFPTYERTVLGDIALTSIDPVKRKMFCTFSITKLAEGSNWFLNACNICHSEVVKTDNIFNCVVCNRNLPLSEKRFCLKVVAEDPTKAEDVYLLDRVVKRLTGISATNLMKSNSKEINEVRQIPEVLANLVGKEVTVTIEVVKSSDEAIGTVLHAVDIYDTNTITPAATPAPTPPDFPLIEYTTINLTDTFDCMDTTKNTDSPNSVNKKIKMEK